MGPKLGYNGKNNGWAIFDQVRIPRENLLNRYVDVDKEGNFSTKGDMRIMYSVMMETRLHIMTFAFDILGRGLLISGRYSAIRRQFKNNSRDKQETKLVDYQTQQHKMFMILASAISFVMSYEHCEKMFNQMLIEVDERNFSRLEVVHHITSGFKSFWTQTANDGLHSLR